MSTTSPNNRIRLPKSESGLAGAAIASIIALALLVTAGTVYLFTRPSETPAPAGFENQKGSDAGQHTRPAGTSLPAQSGNAAGGYAGERLAGTAAPLLDFTAADYNAAKQTDKLIILYFYANWCPICAEEFPHVQAAFNELSSDRVIGFRVNFNDNQTDADEIALARQYGVPYQHTKVFIKNGQQVLKSPESWSQQRYLSEINQALAANPPQ